MSASGRTMAAFLASRPRIGAQAVRLRVQLLQMIGDLARADQGQHVHLAGIQQARHDHRAAAVHGVDDALRKGAAERLEQRMEQQRAVPRRLEHHGVAHDQRRDQRGEGLVERIVVRPHAQHDAERGAPDLPDRAFDDVEARVAVVELLQGLDGRPDVVDRAVELLLGVGLALADLPHDQAHHLLPARDHLAREVLHAGDALGDRHGRPDAPALIVGRHGRGQRLLALGLLAQRVAAELDLLQLAVVAAHAHRRAHGLDGPFQGRSSPLTR